MQKESYLLDLTRYVVLNPFRAKMVDSLEYWHWSSYHFIVGEETPPPWLDTEWLLGQFGTQRSKAIKSYRQFVMEGKDLSSPWGKIRHQLLLGDDAFVECHRQSNDTGALREVSKAHRRSQSLTLHEYQLNNPNRDDAMALAYLSGAYSMANIGKYFGVHYMTVSRAVRRHEVNKEKMLEC